MRIDVPNARLELTPRRALRLDAPRGTLLCAVRGTLWITLDNDPRDIVLDPGEHFVVDSDASLLVLPLHGCATVDLREAQTGRHAAGGSSGVIASRPATPAGALRAPGRWALWRRTLAFS